MSDGEELVSIGDIHTELRHRARADVPPEPVAIGSDYEACVIGAVLLSEGEAMHLAVDAGLVDADFVSLERRFLWRAMRGLYDAGKPITTLTVLDAVRDGKRLDDVGGPAAIARYEALMPTTAIVEPYARRIVEDAVRRRLTSACAGAAAIVAANKPIPETVAAIEQEIARASERGSERSALDAPSMMRDFSVRIAARVEKFDPNRKGIIGLRSGFGDLDKITGGWKPGSLVILGARPSMGKTAAAIQMMLYAAIEERTPTLMFSVEQPHDQIIDRGVACRSSVPLSTIMAGKPEHQDWNRIANASGVMSDAPLWIDDTSAITVDEIRHKARKAKREHGVGLIVIDYLQLVKTKSRRRDETKAEEIGEITSTLKQIARETESCVICLSQLNRGLESRSDKRPMMSDLRDSGSIEADADVIGFLYREEYYLKDKCPASTKGTCEIIIGKNRNGATGSTILRWVPEQVRFENLTDDHNF